MADDEKVDSSPANSKPISLSQAILAPLDAIYESQVHAARSFLNMVLQLAYRHKPVDETGDADSSEKDEPFLVEIPFTQDGHKKKISIPGLALAPMVPLAVKSARFSLKMAIEKTGKRQQIRQSERAVVKEQDAFKTKRPWFLVNEPVNFMGRVAPTKTSDHQLDQSSIQVDVSVESIPLPAGLEKMLTSMSQLAELRDMEEDPNKTGGSEHGE